MHSIIDYIFGAASFMPHGYCLMWRPDLVAMHSISDLLIFLSYASIPAALIVLIKKRPEIEHRYTLILFAAFILSCGMSHLVAVGTLWIPMYGLQGLIKAMTAIVSVITAISIWPLLPELLSIPSPSELQKANASLEQTNAELRDVIQERDSTLAELQSMRALLESRVQERTLELATTNRQLERVNEDLSTFVHVASHDLKEPLRAIHYYSEMIEEDYGEQLKGSGLDCLRSIADLANSISHLISSLRDYSRAGNDDEVIEDLQMMDVLQEVLKNLKPLLIEYDAKVEVANELPNIRCARAHAMTILQNLIVNGIVHGSEKPVIRIESDTTQQGLAVFRIADNGPGIPENMRNQLFKMFQYAKKSDNKKTPSGHTARNAGMGLAIIKRIVDRYSGTITLSSSPDGGASFELKFSAV